jgi:hypothetical protein
MTERRDGRDRDAARERLLDLIARLLARRHANPDPAQGKSKAAEKAAVSRREPFDRGRHSG